MKNKGLPLTSAERNIVENNISLVEIVVKRHININRNIDGLGYEDLVQEGSIGLCAAAKTYNGSVLFETYASKVIRNHLIDHCRKTLRANKHIVLTDNERNLEVVDSYDNESEISFTEQEVSRLLSENKHKYSGCVLKGVEALELKIKGYSGAEIAVMYGVKPNLVGAWISKAVKRLRNDSSFINGLEKCG